MRPLSSVTRLPLARVGEEHLRQPGGDERIDEPGQHQGHERDADSDEKDDGLHGYTAPTALEDEVDELDADEGRDDAAHAVDAAASAAAAPPRPAAGTSRRAAPAG